MLKEFKEFAMKGNLVDIAVGFVMGAAFTRLVTSFTGGIVTPLISMITGDVKFDNCLLYTSPSPRDRTRSRMPSSA